MTRLRRLLTTLALLAPLVATHPAAAAPALGFLDPTYGAESPARFWSDMGTLRASVVRYNLLWSNVAPQPPADASDPADPAYRWDEFDGWIRDATAHGVEPLVTLWFTPSWANRYPSVRGPESVPAPAAWRAFVHAAATRYSGLYDPDGDGPLAPLPRVRLWETWNEPNVYLYGRPGGGRAALVRDYAGMASVAHDEIHGVASAAGFAPTVLLGGLCRSPLPSQTALAPLTFLAGLRRAGARFDAVSLHPYNRYPALGVRDGRTPGSTVTPNLAVGNLDALPRALDRLWPGRRLRVWLTEFGLQSRPNPQIPVSPADQARFLADAMHVLRRPSNRIDGVIWFLVRDEPVRYADGHRGWQSGLRFRDGRPKPSFAAWLHLVA